MSTIRRNRRAAVFAAGLPLAVLAALVAVFVMWAPGSGGGRGAEAAVDPSVDFSMSSAGCNSGGSSTCTVDPGATFTVSFNIDALPSNGSYDGYDTRFNYTSGLTIPEFPAPSTTNFCQNNSGACASGSLSPNWPDCVFNASDFTSTPGQVAAGCAIGIGGASSTYLGALAHLNFTCPTEPASQTITLLAGDGNTDTVDATFAAYSEAADESLTITCGGGVEPTATPTPCEPNCPTATNTPMASPTPMPTSTPTGQCGDANGDGSTNSLDSLWVLWVVAGLQDEVPRPELADMNDDGMINAVDATIILQIDAGLFDC
jgi:hypothetical protein